MRPAGALRIAIGSPLPPPRDLARRSSTGRRSEVLVRVTGANAVFFQSGRARHVRLALNGADIAYRAADWVERVGGFEYTQPLVAPGQGRAAA